MAHVKALEWGVVFEELRVVPLNKSLEPSGMKIDPEFAVGSVHFSALHW